MSKVREQAKLAERDRDAARVLARRLAKYAHHSPKCAVAWANASCDCGLEQILEALGEMP